MGFGVKGIWRDAGVRNGVTVTLLLGAAVSAEPVTVVALGDSLTAGYGLEDQAEGLVPQLEAWLRAKGADVGCRTRAFRGTRRRAGWHDLDRALGPETDALIVIPGRK